MTNKLFYGDNLDVLPEQHGEGYPDLSCGSRGALRFLASQRTR